MMKTPHLALLFSALVLAGCASLPDAPAQPPVPDKFHEDASRWIASMPAEAQDRGAWWKAFRDPVLDALVERAGSANTDIAQVAARLQQARAIARSVDADRYPQLNVGLGVTRQAGQNTLNGMSPATLAQATANVSYEMDVFGRLAHASNAATLDAQARAALLQSTRLLVQAETAQAYLALRAVDAERAIMRDTVLAYQNTLRLTQRRQQAGDVAELDVARVQTELATTQSDAIALDRRRTELEHEIAVLVGEAASAFRVEERDWTTALPRIPAGVPATVLARRPDVSAAQAEILAAQQRVGVARTAWLPNIALTGVGGYASPDLGDLFKWSARAWGVGALLSLPVFDGGRRAAGVESAQAELEGAAAAYRGRVLTAFREVEDQLAALRLLDEQSEAQARAVASAVRATQLSESRYRNGMDSQLDLLDARRSELSSRRQALQVRASQYRATVLLIQALGGGWGA